MGAFEFLSNTFSLRLSFAELGMTDHFIINIADYKRNSGDTSIEIYKLGWGIESPYGNDLDLFIENPTGTFDYYSLQAKIMSDNGAFKDIKNPRNGNIAQWNKLLNHENRFGSKTYYLLYCGNPRINQITQAPTRRDCLGMPQLEELGLSIVETTIIKNLRENTLTPRGQLFFRHVFPNDIDSIRKLFCCFGDIGGSEKKFKLNEINTDKYQKIDSTEQDISNEENIKETTEISENGESKFRIIIKKTT